MRTILNLLKAATVGLIVLTLQACQTTQPVAEGTQLTPTEVRTVFIGTPWHNPSGAFLFREDGTYTYKDFDKPTPRGTWDYEMQEDGTLKGGTTNYTFYRLNDGSYEYYHSQSNRYYSAKPNQPPFL